MTPCPHCGVETKEAQSVCANCGALPGSVWPPPLSGHAPSPPLPKTLTGRTWADFLLGATGQYLMHLGTARVLVKGLLPPNPSDPQHWNEVLGSLFMVAGEMFWAVLFGLLFYSGVRRFYPVMARGAGYTTLVLLAVLLGALFTCRPVPY